MLKRKALRKIIITTFSFLTILVICIIPDHLSNHQFLDPDLHIEYVTNLGTNEIYLLGPNKYLVKTNVLLQEDNLESKVKGIIDYLTIQKSNKIPTGLSGIIPSNTVLNSVSIQEKIVTLDFSSEFLEIQQDLEERMIEAITYSIINLDEVEGVLIQIEGETLTELPHSKKQLPEILNRNYGINKVFDISNLNDIQKVTLYYLDDISNNRYYVPVTRYLNDNREKINIIIDHLASNYIYESNLMSLLNQGTELISYEIQDEMMTLNFNQSIFTNDKLLEEVTYTIAESVFENYDVKSVILEVEGEKLMTVERCCGIQK